MNRRKFASALAASALLPLSAKTADKPLIPLNIVELKNRLSSEGIIVEPDFVVNLDMPVMNRLIHRTCSGTVSIKKTLRVSDYTNPIESTLKTIVESKCKHFRFIDLVNQRTISLDKTKPTHGEYLSSEQVYTRGIDVKSFLPTNPDWFYCSVSQILIFSSDSPDDKIEHTNIPLLEQTLESLDLCDDPNLIEKIKINGNCGVVHVKDRSKNHFSMTPRYFTLI